MLQTLRLIIPIIKMYGIKSYVYVNRTRFNYVLRLSLSYAIDIKVLTVTKYLSVPVYSSEMTTMFQYMASGGAIMVKKAPGIFRRSKAYA